MVYVNSAKTRNSRSLLRLLITSARLLGLSIIFIAILILGVIFTLPVKEEFSYQIRQITESTTELPTPTTSFYLYIPKIEAGSPIIPEVDPYDQSIYQLALSEGVAHALNSAKPGQTGNIFLFAHSSANLLEAGRYNSIFFLLHHLKADDQIMIWYNNQRYTYVVTKSEIVNPSAVSYLSAPSHTEESITLMTCYPPGTTHLRLLVHANRHYDPLD